MAEIELVDAEFSLEPLALAEVDIHGEVSEGEARRLLIRNVGKARIRELVVGVVGEDDDVARHVQLAVEHQDGGPEVWAAPGEPIRAFSGLLPEGGEVPFWARGVYREEDLEEPLAFRFSVRTVSG